MILSVPASATRNVPVVSPIQLVAPQGLADAKTILFKNVLDSLEAFETLVDDNVAGEQNLGSQSTTSQSTTSNNTPSNNTTSSKMSGVLLIGKASPEQTPAPQPHTAPQQVMSPEVAPQIMFPTQNLAQLTATPSLPTQDAEQPEQTLSVQNSLATDAEPKSTEVDSQPSDATSSTLASTPLLGQSLPSSRRIPLAPAARLDVRSQTPSGPANFKPAAPPAPPVSTVPASAPVKTISEPASVAKTSKTETKEVAEPSPASAPTQPEPTRVASSEVIAATQTKGRVANNTPAMNKLSMAAASMPEKPITPVAARVSGELSKVPNEPAAPAVPDKLQVTTSTHTRPAATLSTPKEPIRKAAVVDQVSRSLVMPQPSPTPQPSATPQTSVTPAQVSEPRQALPRQLTQPHPQAESVAIPPTTTPNATPEPATQVAATRLAATAAPIAQPAAAAPKPTNASSRRNSTLPNDAIRPSLPPPVTQVAPVADPVAEKTTPEPRTADASATATDRGLAAELPVVVGEAPKTSLTPKTENLAFAIRMQAPDNASSSTSSDAPLPQTKPAVTVAPPQIEPQPAVNQAKPAPTVSSPEAQQPQSQTPSNSKHETQTPAPAPQKAEMRAPQAASLPQPADARPTVTRWSEVSMPQTSEVGSARFSTELAEPVHTSPVLAAHETHLMTPELPKTSTNSEILLHLTGSDQSSAAIRVADRAGSVNVTVHASDPVLRESLRSNLGELSTQLSQQGWKAETAKPAANAAQPESQQDSHSGGQKSSQQQQSSGGDRQPQRDRRTPGGHWQQELEQQISSGTAHPGGNR